MARRPTGEQGAGRRLWARRVGWLLILWVGGVASLAVIAFLMRMIMRMAGMR
jgi:uncharacterized membrane protein